MPIDLQSLLRVVDFGRDERVACYWELVKRPVDHAFDALEPLGSNLGFAVARIAHILGRLASTDDGLALGVNLFETYPAATLQLVWTTNKWTEATYKGGKAEYLGGHWHAPASKKKSSKARQSEEGKSSGLATLATHLGLKGIEGFQMNDDEFDAVLCALTGCIPECVICDQALAEIIREKLAPNQDGRNKYEPPRGYVVFDRLPSEIQIEVKAAEFNEPGELFEALVASNDRTKSEAGIALSPVARQ